jgi:hypothetical protein
MLVTKKSSLKFKFIGLNLVCHCYCYCNVGSFAGELGEFGQKAGELDDKLTCCKPIRKPLLRLLHMMNLRFSLLNMAQRILGVTLSNF